MLIKRTSTFGVLKNVYLKRTEPLSLVHFLTNRCNARCSFCFIDFEDPNTFANELTLNEIEKLTKNLGSSLLNANFTGGEPFARKEINEIANLYIVNTTIQSIYITTNASFPDRILSLVKNVSDQSKDIELTIQISIDSFPEIHNKVRKIKNLFNTCYEVFHLLKKIDEKVNPVVAITVTENNCHDIKEIYKSFVEKYKFNAIKCIAVRDEGIYKIPLEKKQKIFEAYSWLSKQIATDSKNKILKNYNYNSIQGRLHAKKDIIANKMVQEMYMKPKYISPCHAGSLFGIINPSGSVYPCEILENKKIGELRDYDMNFIKMWKEKQAKEIKKFILKSKCSCTYECALSYNILSNWRYQLSMISAAMKY